MSRTVRKGGMMPKMLGGSMVAVQSFDVIIHAATDQLEPLRIASNLLIMAWAVLWMAGRSRRKSRAAVSIGGYLVLNGLFLLLDGPRNANGDLRVVLFLLVAATVVLWASMVFVHRDARSM